MNTTPYKYIKKQKGYTLLFSILIATLVLGVAVFILSVSTKQYQLSITARDSMYAVYAADGGLECAISNLDNNRPDPLNDYTALVDCGGITNSDANLGGPYPFDNPEVADMDFKPGTDSIQYAGMKFGFIDGSCALVTVTFGTDAVTNSSKTIIDSRGYNICPGTPSSKSRIVERQLRLIRQ